MVLLLKCFDGDFLWLAGVWRMLAVNAACKKLVANAVRVLAEITFMKYEQLNEQQQELQEIFV